MGGCGRAPPGSGEVLLRHTAVGLNYADVNLRNGTFYINTKLPLPAILGNEGAGVVESLGPGVGNVKNGRSGCLCHPERNGATRFLQRTARD